MKPPLFEYSRPETIGDALHLLNQNGDEGKVLAGGQSLIPLLAFRMARPSHLVDIGSLDDLKNVDLSDGGLLTMGALATHRTLEKDASLMARCPAIYEAVAQIGHVAIRNRGTVGGSIAHADPAAEWPALALLFDTNLEVRSEAGDRVIPAAEMFLSYMTTALTPQELLVEIRMQLPPPTAGTSFVEVSRRHGDFALAGAGSVIEIDDGLISSARVAVMSAGLTPIRATDVETALIGAEPNEEIIESASENLESMVDPMEDVHGTSEYKRHLARVMTKRSIGVAVQRAGGDPQ